MDIDSMNKLFVHELKDLYSAENQILEALPKMARRRATKLKSAFEEHLSQTRSR
jgi:ferritin-like metal-binding protein YciE